MHAARGFTVTDSKAASGGCRINDANKQGGEEPMIVIQLSDPHILAPGELLYRRFDTAEFLARAVAEINRLDPLPDVASSPATSSITANPPNTSICERC